MRGPALISSAPEEAPGRENVCAFSHFTSLPFGKINLGRVLQCFLLFLIHLHLPPAMNAIKFVVLIEFLLPLEDGSFLR